MIALLSMSSAQGAVLDKSLEGVACRSVHLAYQDVPEATAFYNEVRVEASAPGTYFCVCGFSRGYYGLQELADGRKVLIFSVWDPGNQNEPDSVEESQRVRLLHQAPDVRVKRFGNEGTGGQSFLDFDWQVGTTYRFLVTARRRENRTHYASFFFHPQQNAWLHLVTFSTLTPDQTLKGYYAFVEDFRRNRESATHPRIASFPGPAVRTADGMWRPVTRARFTADSNPVENINAGVKQDQFYLATGGNVTNADVPLGQLMIRPVPSPPTGLPVDAESVVQRWLDEN